MCPSDQYAPECHAIPSRVIPDPIKQTLQSRPGIVEDLADVISLYNWGSVLEWPHFAHVSHVPGVIVGPIVTALYRPRITPGPDLRLAHDVLANQCQPGSIVVCQARDVGPAVIGGGAAKRLQQAGVVACVVEGVVRDVPEMDALGLALVSQSVGVSAARSTAELASINEVVVVNDTRVQPGGVGVMNSWGMILISDAVTWDEILSALDIA